MSALSRRAAVVLVAAAAAAVPLGSASAGAPSNGCPNGYTLMVVAGLTPLGYQIPGRLDDPTSGLKSFSHVGNGDGLVCGVPLGNQTGLNGVQIYNFWDNTLKA